jgi:UDP-N-acetyl-D-glucosamine dehydrogenase
MRILSEKGANLIYNDPYVPTVRLGKNTINSTELSSDVIAQQDCVIILTDHSDYDFKTVVAGARLVIDTRNATKDLNAFTDNIIKLGAGNRRRAVSDYQEAREPTAIFTAH